MTPPLPQQFEDLRQDSLNAIEDLGAERPACDLPAPPEALASLRERLQQNRYRVLVVGEAKRGKSSFINALIGRPLLPTDVDIATSQVFLVNKAAEEDYRVRFEDDTVKEIAATELEHYGSQVLADQESTPRLDQVIRWIEVDVPVRFLPDGVSVLDTPGLGSLYAAHSLITQRFLPQADAVIYVLTSGEPLGQRDLETIGAILDITPNVLFIQTQIDCFAREAWQEVQARNEQVLREELGDKLADPRVWPISCTLLMKAAETGDEDYEVLSRHRELAAELKAFLFRVAGLSRVATAILAAGQYHESARQALQTRVADLLSESKEQRVAVQRDMAERKRRFDSDWGERGEKRQALMHGIREVVTGGKQQMRQALESGGDIDRKWRDKIKALTSLPQAQALGERLAEGVTQDAIKKWQQIDQDVRDAASERLVDFETAMEALSLGPAGSSLSPETAAAGYQLPIQDDWIDKFKGFRQDFMSVGFVAGLGYVVASTVFPPVAVGVALAGSLWALVQGGKGWGRAKEQKLRQAQQALHAHLHSVRDQARRYYFDVDVGAGRLHNLVDTHFDDLAQQVGESVQQLASERSAEAQRELERLKQQAELDEKQRTERLGELRACLAEWDTLGKRLQRIVEQTQRLEQALSEETGGAQQDKPA